MKKIFIFLVIFFMMFITSCDNSQSDDNIGVPEGAIKLTKNNFEEYFKIRVDNKEGWWEHGMTANAYVSVSPKDFYQEVVGTVEIKVDSYIYKYDSSTPTARILSSNAKLYLNNDVVNECYTLSCQGYDYKINYSSNTFELVNVSGYIIIGEQEPSELEKITEEEITNSDSVKSEIESLIEKWIPICTDAKNYEFDKEQSYIFKSYYGDDYSKIGGSYNNFKALVDVENKVCSKGTDVYYAYNDYSIHQQKLFNGMIDTNIYGPSVDNLISECTFDFDGLIDSSCVFIKENDETYYGYTNFDKMERSHIRDYLLAAYNSSRIKSNYDDMIVKYTYFITDDSLEVKVEVSFKDYHFHINYYEINYEYSQKISNVNQTVVKPYSTLENTFILEEELEDALIANAGLVKIDCSTTEIKFVTYNEDYDDIGVTNTYCDNYLPIEITEPGVYKFENIKYGIFDANGKIYNEQYFEKGIYYIRIENVKYGVTNCSIKVDASRFKDYGDLNNPVVIVNNEFSCYLEGYADLNVYLFTPDKDGIYEFKAFDGIEIYIYNQNNPTEELYNLYYNQTSCFLENGIDYLIVIESMNNEINYEGEISYIGIPSINRSVTFEWNEFLLLNDFSLDCEITKVGNYQVEIEVLMGEYAQWKNFYYENGDSIDYNDHTYDENGIATYTLNKGKYKLILSSYQNRYLKARIRLVLVTEGVEEETKISLSNDEYTTITSSVLTTNYSTSKFYFEVDKDSYLLITTISSFFKICDINGNAISITSYPYYVDKEFNNIETKKSALLKAGSYCIVFERTRYDTNNGTYQASVRLLDA